MRTVQLPKGHVVDLPAYLGRAQAGLPVSLRVLAENALRQGGEAALADVVARQGAAVPFRPARLLLQDMLGLPLLVDMMALRDKIAEAGGDPGVVDMSLPVDLVIDHSMTIQHWADKLALPRNMAREFEVNHERFAFLRACEARFASLRVVPPGGGIMHQVNLEYLGRVIQEADGGLWVPDTNLGTDSHTPMINALGVLGWGIGGLEAEALLFGEATAVNVPRVIGIEVQGTLDSRMTATDIALTLAERLRAIGVVDCFVELFGPGYAGLSVPDRATIANMAPEYGATSVFCPVDAATLRYLRETGRPADLVTQVEAATSALGLAAPVTAPQFDEVVTLDLGTIGRSVAGPAKPEQRLDLGGAAPGLRAGGSRPRVPVGDHDLGDDDVIIAAITSCTNTANTRNMILAGLVARNAVARGLQVAPHVKTSLAPGSRAVAGYLRDAGLQDPLDALGFQVAAFACSTCNGMSGPLDAAHEAAIRDHDIRGVAVLSGNRNFAGRIHPLASRNLLAAPPLVVAYALAGTVRGDLTRDPLGNGADGAPVTLADLWPDETEVQAIMARHVTPDLYAGTYAALQEVNDDWTALPAEATRYDWPRSTYVSLPPFVSDIAASPAPADLTGLRPLALLGDSVTTDHISPSGTILPESAAGQYLQANGVTPRDFNSFGTRRGCSDVVIRSCFANVRLRNEMTPDREGPWTRLEPGGTPMPMFDAISTYRARRQGLVVIGGRDYGCGSSRDTAAKAPWLAGVRAVIAESFERIHRSNLVNMGIAPLCFPAGVTRQTLGLTGSEVFDIALSDDLTSARLTIQADGAPARDLPLDLRLYNDAERATFRAGGLLPRVYRQFLTEAA